MLVCETPNACKRHEIAEWFIHSAFILYFICHTLKQVQKYIDNYGPLSSRGSKDWQKQTNFNRYGSAIILASTEHTKHVRHYIKCFI